MRDQWFATILYKEWGANRAAHLIVIAIISLTLLMYCIYGAWSTQEEGPVRFDSLDTGSHLLVYYPDWAMEFENPRFDVSVFSEGGTFSRVREGVITQLTSSQGEVLDAWGVDLTDSRFLQGLDLIEGEFPESEEGQVCISEEARRITGVDTGDKVELVSLDPDSGDKQTRDFEVTGIISADDAWKYLVVGDAEQFAHLADVSRYNAAWLWGSFRQFDRILSSARNELISVRAPAYPFENSPAAEGDRSQALKQYGGVPSPFLHRVEPILWHENTVADRVSSMQQTGVASVSGLIGLMFFMVALALTVTVLIIVLDRQRIIGTYAVLGMSSEDIGRMFRSQLILDSIIGTVLGVLIFFLFVNLAPTDELGMNIPLLTIILWIVFQTALVLWGGRIAWVLSGERNLRNHLRGDANFDWWALVDVWPRPVGAEEEGRRENDRDE